MLASAVMGEAAMENIRLSRVSDGTLLRSLLSFYVSALAFSPDGEILAAGKRLGEVELWDVSKGNMLHELYDQAQGGLFARWLAPGFRGSGWHHPAVGCGGIGFGSRPPLLQWMPRLQM